RARRLRPLPGAGRLLPVGRLQDRAPAPEVPAAPAGIAHRPVLEDGRGVCAGEAARLDESGVDPAAGPPGDALDAGRRHHLNPLRGYGESDAQAAPAGDGARSTDTSIEPVLTSCSTGKYMRCTAAIIASTIRSRTAATTSCARSDGEVRYATSTRTA